MVTFNRVAVLSSVSVYVSWRQSIAYAFSPSVHRLIQRNVRYQLSLSKDSDSDSDSDSHSAYDGLEVMVNGMPGPMATAAAEACLRKGLSLSPIAMTGPDIPASTITVVDPVTSRHANVRLIPSNSLVELTDSVASTKEALTPHGRLVAIDYTHPSAVNANARFYVTNQIPFVMGTTGGDRDELMRDVSDGGLAAVIAPNMGKQIVAMQAALEDLAQKFPAAFAGYDLHVEESHQETKADTSGTAKAVVDSIKKLSNNPDYSYDDIEMIRDDQESMDFGVREQDLNGHAFHTYTLTSPDSTVEFVLKHNVSGRTVYAEGTADAVKFLYKKLQHDSQGKIYSMINVLEEGAME